MMRRVSAPEDDDTQRHGRPSPPPPAPQWHAAAPQPYTLYEQRGRETVINGTTWYHHPLPELHGHSGPQPHGAANFSVNHHSMAPRYGTINPVNSLGFESRPRPRPRPRPQPARPPHSAHHRNPHAVSHGLIPHSPYAHGPVRAHPAMPYYDGPSGVMPSYHYDDGPHDTMAYDKGPHGVMPRYPYVGPGRAYGGVPSYGAMPCYPFDGSAREYTVMPSPAMTHGSMPSPARAHGTMRSPARAHPSHEAHVPASSIHASLGVPPHAIQTAGRTTRQVVSWCGMTMPVTVTSQAAAMIEWIQKQTGDLFGFDLEWKPNFMKGEDNKVALLQLCGPNDCLIIQLLYTDMIPNTLVEFLLNPKKWLGGVGIRQDVNKLERDHGLACQGQVELGTLASEKLQRSDLQGRGLKKLVDQVLGMALVKIKRITMSNWEKEYLDGKQIEYACIDAWAAFAILQKLMAQ